MKKDASVIICTYRREKILVNTIKKLLVKKENTEYNVEMLVVDQKARHKKNVKSYLEREEKSFEYYNLDEAGLTKARNFGCGVAKGEILIFFDDDIIPKNNPIEGHIETHDKKDVKAVCGQVLEEGEKPKNQKGMFKHNNFEEKWYQIYGANFSIKKEFYEEIGGSDENLGVHSYSEDIILAKKIFRNGGNIMFNPEASVIHLAHPQGGCRITDESQPTAEWEKSFSKLYMALQYSDDVSSVLRFVKGALRQGPLRRENIAQPWRQPGAWYGFFRALWKAWRSDRSS